MTLHEAPHISPGTPVFTVSWARCSAMRGCTGRAVEPYEACVAHLPPREFKRYLGDLRPGSDLDLRGVTVTAELLDVLLDAVTGGDLVPHLGRVRCDGAWLPEAAVWRAACIEGDCSFDGAYLAGWASFFGVVFLGHVSFQGARFGGNASFHGARFGRHSTFDEAVFGGDALFGETRWGTDCSFARAVFLGAAAFDQARFGRDMAMPGACFGEAASFRRVHVGRHARFERARFRHGLWLGPLVAGGTVTLSNVQAQGNVRVQAAAERVVFENATVRGTGDLRLRHAEVSLENTRFEGRAAVRTARQPFTGLEEPPGCSGPARVTSLRGASADRLELADLDLSACRFLGMRRPEGLVLSGPCTFVTLPTHRGVAVAEDSDTPHEGLAAVYGHLARATDDHALARELRYRAMETRRHTETNPLRRWLLHAFWLTCGYGLRMGRTVLWAAIVTAMLIGGLTVVRCNHHHQQAAHRPPMVRRDAPVSPHS